MSLVLFEGVAGTGKTTELIKAVQKHISARPLSEVQRVLALTKMHGSRKRMEVKLSNSLGLKRCADCITIDSFARNLVRRWRGLLQSQLGSLPSDGDFQSISSAAAHLLKQNLVGNWVSHRYPIILVDEMQDCRGPEVEIFQGLSAFSDLFCAADEFQDLSGVLCNEAVEWARISGRIETLKKIHRTSDSFLLEAFRALRCGDPLPTQKTPSFEICPVPSAALGGAVVTWRIKSWLNSSQIVIISPVRRDTSPFVNKVVNWVSSQTAKTKRSAATAGPFQISWESSEDEALNEILTSLGLLQDSNCELDVHDLAEAAMLMKAVDVQNWFLKQIKLRGMKRIIYSEACDHIRRIVHQRRAFGFVFPKKFFALTIHQAKNREFDAVIVLWPMKLRDNPEQIRRLLYNAITRAKNRAIVIVEDPRQSRLNFAPFSGNTKLS